MKGDISLHHTHLTSTESKNVLLNYILLYNLCLVKVHIKHTIYMSRITYTRHIHLTTLQYSAFAWQTWLLLNAYVLRINVITFRTWLFGDRARVLLYYRLVLMHNLYNMTYNNNNNNKWGVSLKCSKNKKNALKMYFLHNVNYKWFNKNQFEYFINLHNFALSWLIKVVNKTTYL